MNEITITLPEEQVLTVITALGVLKDRIGQKASWNQRKRLPTLRSRLADCIAIGDETESANLRKALAKTQRDIDSRIARAQKIAQLRDTIKQMSGATDERLRDFKIDEMGGVNSHGVALEDKRCGGYGRPEAPHTARGWQAAA